MACSQLTPCISVSLHSFDGVLSGAKLSSTAYRPAAVLSAAGLPAVVQSSAVLSAAVFAARSWLEAGSNLRGPRS